MGQLQLYCHMQPRAALELARTLSSTCSRSPELLGTRSFLLFRLLDRSLSNSQVLIRTRSHSLALARIRSHWLASPLIRTRSNSLTFARTRSPGAAKPFSFHSLLSCYSSNESICYVATKFCGDVTAKQNSKECP